MYHGHNDVETLIANGNVSGSALSSRYAPAPDYHNDEGAEYRFYQRNYSNGQGTGSTNNGAVAGRSNSSSSHVAQFENSMSNSAHHTGGASGGSLGMSPGASGGTSSSNGSNGSSSHTGSSAPLIYPALHLQPLNDTFAPKQISLAPPGPQNKIKIGRQTNAKTIPQPNNGYFDSKVLSRMHAEVWSQDGKVYIKDVKSSNGTFINNTRLSPEGQESEVFELNNDDLVEFGIDIVGDDNKTIIHHKVACRVFLVITAEEALGLRHDFAALYRGGIAGSTLNHHSVGPGAEGGLRRGKLGSMSSYGTNGSSNGFVSFDHVIHRLQAELAKSRETASNLTSLNSSMSDIGETLGGGLAPMHNPPYQHMVPSFNADGSERQSASGSSQREAWETSEKARLAEIKALEEQVRETQASLSAHVERLVGLESRVEEHDSVKSNVLVITKQVEEARKELAEAVRQRDSALTSNNVQRLGSDRDASAGSSKSDSAYDESDFDDAASAASMETLSAGDAQHSGIGKGPLGVDEVESADMLGNMSLREVPDVEDDSRDATTRIRNHVGPLAPPDGPEQAADKKQRNLVNIESTRSNDELNKRLEAMESQLERALELGRTLAGQHAESTETVKRLEDRIKSLETEHSRLDGSNTELSEKVREIVQNVSSDEKLKSTSVDEKDSPVSEAVLGTAATGGILALVESKWGTWREAFEADFYKDRTAMQAEREELRRIVLAWDNLNQDLEDAVDSVNVSSSSSSVAGDDHRNIAQRFQGAAVSNQSGAIAASRSKKKKKGRGGGSNAAAGRPVSAASLAPNGQSAATSPLPSDDSATRLNRELRALLYTEDFNVLVRDEHVAGALNVSKASAALIGDAESSATTDGHTSVAHSDVMRSRDLASPEREGAESPATAQGGTSSASTRSATSEDGSRAAGAGTSSSSGANLTPEELKEGVRKRVMMSMAQRKKKGRWADGATHGFDNPASLPVLGAAGVLVVGMTAWIMAGKGVHLGSGPGGGWN